jgi:hypothetical protein
VRVGSNMCHGERKGDNREGPEQQSPAMVGRCEK